MRRLLLSIAVVLIAVLPAAAQTQETPAAFAIGDIVEGEVTGEATEAYFTFSAKQNMVIVVEMRRAPDSQLFSTALRVLDPSGQPVADSTGEVSSDVTTVAFVAPANGKYTVTATRSRYSSSTGAFLLRALEVITLESGATFKDTISNNTYDRYFALPAGMAVAVSYRPLDDRYQPTFRVLAADSSGILKTLAEASAAEGVTMMSLLETEAGGLYVVAVTASNSDYQYSRIDVEFELSLEAAG